MEASILMGSMITHRTCQNLQCQANVVVVLVKSDRQHLCFQFFVIHSFLFVRKHCCNELNLN